MPQCVVDAFEAVQVQIEQRGHPALPSRARQGLPKPVFEHGAIGKARQQVVGGLVRQFLLHPLALGNIGDQPVPVSLSVSLMNVYRAAVEPGPLPVLLQKLVFDVDRPALFEKRPKGSARPARWSAAWMRLIQNPGWQTSSCVYPVIASQLELTKTG